MDRMKLLEQMVIFDNRLIRKMIRNEQFKLIGCGVHGRVLRLSYKGFNIAVKEFHQRDSTYSREIGALSKISHPHIVKFYKSYNMDDDQRPLMIVELSPNGSLSHLLFPKADHDRRSYSIQIALSWCRQIAAAVEYLHTVRLDDDGALGGGPKRRDELEKRTGRPVMHRDLKPANVLLFDDYQLAKICDFGLARLDNSIDKTAAAGSLLYMAAEVFGTQSYTGQCDVYSAGVTFYEILHRTPAHKNLRRADWLGQDPTQPALKFLYWHSLLDQPDLRPTMSILHQVLQSLCRTLPHPGLDSVELCPGDVSSPRGKQVFVDNFTEADVLCIWIKAIFCCELPDATLPSFKLSRATNSAIYR